MLSDENPILGQKKASAAHHSGGSSAHAPLNKHNTGSAEAVKMLRDKIGQLYTHEPSAKAELNDAEAASGHRSKHQQFMHQLSLSGKSLAEIQTAWHQYYVNLPDNEKHQVWQEFYSQHANQIGEQARHGEGQHHAAPTSRHEASVHQPHAERPHRKRRKGHAGHSILFGLSMGLVAMAIMLFGFFNERFIAPFISPSKNVSNTPIIIDPSTTAVGSESKIIIPKINVEIPVIFDEESTDEKAIQTALEEGVIHYATTSNPGETGNGAIFGHSSNNILNKGKYKFAFVLLKRLETGDIFYVQKDGKRFVYRVYKKTVVTPEETSVLGAQDKPATMSLITCDPPGTSINRLVVVGEQISPDISSNVASSAKPLTEPEKLPSNAPTLWSRITSWFSS